MARLLFLAAVALLLAYYLSEGLSRLRGRLGELLGAGPPAAPERERARRGAELVACAVCGVHVPRPRAIEGTEGRGETVASRFYCSAACHGAASGGAASLKAARRS